MREPKWEQLKTLSDINFQRKRKFLNNCQGLVINWSITKIKAPNKATIKKPLILCRIDTIPGIGSLIAKRFKYFGLGLEIIFSYIILKYPLHQRNYFININKHCSYLRSKLKYYALF